MRMFVRVRPSIDVSLNTDPPRVHCKVVMWIPYFLRICLAGNGYKLWMCA